MPLNSIPISVETGSGNVRQSSSRDYGRLLSISRIAELQTPEQLSLRNRDISYLGWNGHVPPT